MRRQECSAHWALQSQSLLVSLTALSLTKVMILYPLSEAVITGSACPMETGCKRLIKIAPLNNQKSNAKETFPVFNITSVGLHGDVALALLAHSEKSFPCGICMFFSALGDPVSSQVLKTCFIG